MNTRDRMRVIAPTLESVSDLLLDTYIELAEEQMDVGAWGTLYQTGVSYLACHIASIAGLTIDSSGQNQGSAAGVQTVRTQDMSVSYGQTSSSVTISAGAETVDLLATHYGRAWIRLQTGIPGPTP